MKIFYLYSDSVKKKNLTKTPELNDIIGLYFLYGKDIMLSRGYDVIDDFDSCERVENSPTGKLINFFINSCCRLFKASGGDWYKILALRRKLKKADIIFSTVDKVGIPLVILTYLKIIPKRIIVYTSIGLPERFNGMSSVSGRVYRRIIASSVDKIICYGWGESIILKKIFGDEKVRFIPFGANIEYFHPVVVVEDEDYLISVGADRYRDLDLLFNIADSLKCKIVLVTTKTRILELKKKRDNFPDNVSIFLDIPLPEVKNLLAKSKFVILPVKENTYSGATTTLLQAMAMSKAVIVSSTSAITQGYRLINGKNCILIKPRDQKGFLQEVKMLLSDKKRVRDLGKNARNLVEKYFSWNTYVDKLSLIFDSLFHQK